MIGAFEKDRELPVIGKAVKGQRLPLKGTPPVIGKNSLCIGSVRDQVKKLELNAVALKDVPWIKYMDGKNIVEMTSDSGAAATVVPRGAFDDDLIRASRTETEVFATASGHRMPTYGNQRIKAMSNNGIGMNITAQATDVKKPLISVQEMCKKGNHVVSREN